ncbi:hypothetical protein BC835DRAFT_764522 [Cytidiella melzeri]|nr:hypothetical protein BC835DRAFT_764522 [Cytidiella melzeri]
MGGCDWSRFRTCCGHVGAFPHRRACCCALAMYHLRTFGLLVVPSLYNSSSPPMLPFVAPLCAIFFVLFLFPLSKAYPLRLLSKSVSYIQLGSAAPRSLLCVLISEVFRLPPGPDKLSCINFAL